MSIATDSSEPEESATAEMLTDALDPHIAQVLDGRFRIVDLIGKGAMGKVYRAVQLPLNRTVAVKLLDSRHGAGRDESFRQRFLVEAALTSKLSHPNTVRVLDYGSTSDGVFFLAMEYLDGETLENVLRRGPLAWHRALSITQQIARALREAHELGVVHRDLKPGNVVLLHGADDTDFVKVLDFGLVKSFVEGHELEGRAITQQGMLIGSPPYMAPEQGEKNRADPRSDIYSLATMLFEMLTGQPPFTGKGSLEVILKHVHEPVPPLVAPRGFEAIPPGLDAIVMKCLAKSPMDRFQTMDELLLALQDVAEPRASTQEFSMAEPQLSGPLPSLVPEEESAPRHERSHSLLLMIPTFFLAALLGVLGTWALVKPSTPSAKLMIHLESTPAGASVIVEGKVLGHTPVDLEQNVGTDARASVEMRLEKEGFSAATLTLTGARGQLGVSQTLTALPPITPVAVPSAIAPAAAKAEPVKPKPPVADLKKKAKSGNGFRSSAKLSDEDAPHKVELRRPTAQP